MEHRCDKAYSKWLMHEYETHETKAAACNAKLYLLHPLFPEDTISVTKSTSLVLLITKAGKETLMDKCELQELDLKILDAVKHDARKTYEQIAREVGLSRTAVKSRMQAMEESGVIVGYETRIKKANADSACRFILDVETNPHDFEAVKNYLGSSAFIQELYITSGSCHLHAVGVAFNQPTLQAYANKVYKELGDVRKLSIYSVLSVCKDVDGGVEYVREEKSKE